VTRQRQPVDARLIGRHHLFPHGEVRGAGKWRKHQELRERDIGALGDGDRRVEGGGPVARQTEDERPEWKTPEAPGGFVLLALGLLFAAAVSVERSPEVQPWVLKPGRWSEAVAASQWLAFLVLLNSSCEIVARGT